MVRMLSGASSFNSDVSAWNVGSATNMNELFMGASLFDSNLSGWDFSAVTHASNMLKSTAFTRTNYDALLLSLSQQTLNNEVEFGVHGVNYCTSAAERQSIIDTFSWTITDGGLDCD